MEQKKLIGLASDHAGFPLKQHVKNYLEAHGMAWRDYGCPDEQSCDYPDYGHALAEGVLRGEVDGAIAICGSGQGISMTLNKHAGIRAGLAWNTEMARLMRQHNNANVLVMPGRFIAEPYADEVMDTYFATEFEGGRHARRVAKIDIHHAE